MSHVVPSSDQRLITALREIDQILESPNWYDGEDAMEALLDRLGLIVQRALPAVREII
jgi:hypothetical protein